MIWFYQGYWTCEDCYIAMMNGASWAAIRNEIDLKTPPPVTELSRPEIANEISNLNAQLQHHEDAIREIKARQRELIWRLVPELNPNFRKKKK
jgi:hypothetical protein